MISSVECWACRYAGRRTTTAQYDLTLTGRNCFKTPYACEARWSVHTAFMSLLPRKNILAIAAVIDIALNAGAV